MSKKFKVGIILILIAILCIISFLLFSSNDNTELKAIKSDKELSKIYNYNISTAEEIITTIFTMPFSFFLYNNRNAIYF